MAFTTLAVTTSDKAGIVLPAASAADGTNGNNWVNSGREMVELTNGSGGSITATIVTTLAYQGFAIADLAVSVAAGTTKLIGPFDTTLFNNSTDGTVGMTYSAATSVTVRVIKLGSI